MALGVLGHLGCCRGFGTFKGFTSFQGFQDLLGLSGTLMDLGALRALKKLYGFHRNSPLRAISPYQAELKGKCPLQETTQGFPPSSCSGSVFEGLSTYR